MGSLEISKLYVFQSCLLVWYAGYLEKNSVHLVCLGGSVLRPCQGESGGAGEEIGATSERSSVADVARPRLVLSRCASFGAVSF